MPKELITLCYCWQNSYETTIHLCFFSIKITSIELFEFRQFEFDCVKCCGLKISALEMFASVCIIQTNSTINVVAFYSTLYTFYCVAYWRALAFLPLTMLHHDIDVISFKPLYQIAYIHIYCKLTQQQQQNHSLTQNRLLHFRNYNQSLNTQKRTVQQCWKKMRLRAKKN